jgi:hypothetical protein
VQKIGRKGLQLRGGFHQPLKYRVGVNLEDPRRAPDAYAFGQTRDDAYDEVRFMPIWEHGVLHASGPRVAVSGLGLIPLCIFSAPLEEVQVKS